ncbi:hypothetical protein Tco_0732231 [Tanacetum coccineum]
MIRKYAKSSTRSEHCAYEFVEQDKSYVTNTRPASAPTIVDFVKHLILRLLYTYSGILPRNQRHGLRARSYVTRDGQILYFTHSCAHYSAEQDYVMHECEITTGMICNARNWCGKGRDVVESIYYTDLTQVMHLECERRYESIVDLYGGQKTCEMGSILCGCELCTVGRVRKVEGEYPVHNTWEPVHVQCVKLCMVVIGVCVIRANECGARGADVWGEETAVNGAFCSILDLEASMIDSFALEMLPGLVDDDETSVDEGTSRVNTLSPTTYYNSLPQDVPQIFTNPPLMSKTWKPLHPTNFDDESTRSIA